jgi:hypothetical protein
MALRAAQADAALAKEDAEALRRPVEKLHRAGRFGRAPYRGIGNF